MNIHVGLPRYLRFMEMLIIAPLTIPYKKSAPIRTNSQRGPLRHPRDHVKYTYCSGDSRSPPFLAARTPGPVDIKTCHAARSLITLRYYAHETSRNNLITFPCCACLFWCQYFQGSRSYINLPCRCRLRVIFLSGPGSARCSSCF